MTVLEKTKEALDLSQLKLPPIPRVLSISAEGYEDWEGMPSLKVQIIIDDATDLDTVTGQMWGDLTSAVRQSLRDHGVQEFAYIDVAMPSELQDSDDEYEE